MSARTGIATLVVGLLVASLAGRARAEAGSADATWREAQTGLRDAAHDTLGHGDDATRLDALAAAQLRVARLADAQATYRRALAMRPDDREAWAGLGRIALCQQREAEAESLLALAGDAEGAAGDLYRARLRRHEWAAAAEMAEAQGEGGRREMLERLAASAPMAIEGGPARAVLPFVRAWPVPIVRVRIGRAMVPMVLDPGANELLLDPAAAQRTGVAIVPGERTVGWSGARVQARNAMVARLDLGGLVLANVPAAVTPLHAYNLQANPDGEAIAGVVGLPVLERFGVTIDFARHELELRRPETAYAPPGTRVPFERWGENDLMVYGTVADHRRMALWFATGMPSGGFGAPQETFDEIGIRPGRMANLVRNVGTALQGRSWSEVVVPTVSVGAIVCGRVESWSGAMDPDELWRWGPRRDGVLGPMFFNNRRVTIDWARHELVFEDR